MISPAASASNVAGKLSASDTASFTSELALPADSKTLSRNTADVSRQLLRPARSAKASDNNPSICDRARPNSSIRLSKSSRESSPASIRITSSDSAPEHPLLPMVSALAKPVNSMPKRVPTTGDSYPPPVQLQLTICSRNDPKVAGVHCGGYGTLMAAIRRSTSRGMDRSAKPKFAAFDLETRELVDNDKQGLEKGALGVTCIGLMLSGQQSPEMWYGKEPNEQIASQMSRGLLSRFVDRLKTLLDDGFTIATWNGLNFDFRVLAAESGRFEDCRMLATRHVDMMFNIFCEKGWPVGIAQVASGMGLRGKTKGMDGMEAVRIWNEEPHRRQEVIRYAANDVDMTLKLAELGSKHKVLHWSSLRGRPQQLDLPRGWLTCELADRLPEPDNSWMDDPLERSDFTDWTTSP